MFAILGLAPHGRLAYGQQPQITVVPAFPPEVTVGDTGVSASVTITSRTLVPILLVELIVDPGTRGVRLSPRGSGGGPACPSATFDVTGPDPAGRYSFRPQTLLNIVPIDLILLDTCTVSFAFDVVGGDPATATQSTAMHAVLAQLPFTVTSHGTSSMRINSATSGLDVEAGRSAVRVDEPLPVRAQLTGPGPPSGSVEFRLHQDASCTGPTVAPAAVPAAAITTARLRPDRPGRHWVGATNGTLTACSRAAVQVTGPEPPTTTSTRPTIVPPPTVIPDPPPTTTVPPTSVPVPSTSTTTTTLAAGELIADADEQLRLEIAVLGLLAVWLPFAVPGRGGRSGGSGVSGGSAPPPLWGGGRGGGEASLDRESADDAPHPEAGEREGWGDRSFTFRAPGRAVVDRASRGLPGKVAGASPLLARMLADGTAWRAAFGSLSLAVPLGATAAAVAAGVQAGEGATSVGLPLVLALMLVGAFDALAGFAGALAFSATVAATGGLDSMDAARFVVCLSAAFYAPVLIGGAVRPVRRRPTRRGVDHAERVSDSLVVAFLGGLAAFTALKALPGAAGRQAPLAQDAEGVALLVAAALAVRVMLETVVAHGYPARLRAVCPGELPRPGLLQQIVSHALGVALFLWIVAAYTPLRWQILLAVGITLIPVALSCRGGAVAKLHWVRWLVPTGFLRVVVVMAVGFLLADLAKDMFPETERLIRWSVLLLAVPVAHLTMLSLLAPADGQAWGLRSEVARSAVGMAALLVAIGAAVAILGVG